MWRYGHFNPVRPQELELCILYILTPFNFFYKDVEELDADLAMQLMKIAIIGDEHATIEGTKILLLFCVLGEYSLQMLLFALGLCYC